jgi:hypothetical protein
MTHKKWRINMKKMYNYIVISLFVLSFGTVSAQVSVSGGADFVTRYVWRGLDFGNSFSVQPSLALSAGGFEAGFWGSYPFTNTSNGSEEMDLYLGYAVGDFSVIVTDYYFPNSGLKYGKYKEPGAHTIEVGLSYGGSEAFPISIAAYMNVYNDDDNTIYFELGYSTEVSDVGIDLFVAGTPGGDGAYYGTTDFNLINIGITASKEISITDQFSLPIFSSYVLNPNLEVAYLIFGLSLGM